MKNFSLSLVVCFITIAGIVSSSGCLSTPFEVAGDVVSATFDVAGAVAEVPFAILEAGIEVPCNLHQTVQTEYHQDITDLNSARVVRVETRNGSIDIRGTEGTEQGHVKTVIEVRARSFQRASDFLPKVYNQIDRQGDALVISPKYPHPGKDVFVMVRYEIELPKRLALDLNSTNAHIHVSNNEDRVNARTTNGWVTVTDSRSNLELHTSNGDITAERVSGIVRADTSNAQVRMVDVQGEMFLESTNGRVEIRESAGRVLARTTNGDIVAHLRQLQGSGEFFTTNGSVNVAFDDGLAPLTIQTENASIDLTLPFGFQGRLNAHTTHARVQAELPMMVNEVGQDWLRGQIGSDSGVEVHLQSTHGDIHIRRQDGGREISRN